MPSKKLPLVSVVIPTHNRLELLYRAIDSVMAQTYKNLEVIVVDDASTEDLSPLKKRYPKNLRILRNEKNLGQHKSRIQGMLATQSDYIALLDSDDWWAPEKLEKQLEIISQKPHALVSCRIRIENGFSKHKVIPKLLYSGERVEDFWFLKEGILQTSTWLGDRETMIRLHQETKENDIHTDLTLALTAQKNKIEIIQHPQPLTCFESILRSDRISTNHNRIKQSEEWFKSYTEDWPPLTRQAYLFSDRVPRLINCGMYGRALKQAIRSYSHQFGIKNLIKYIILAVTANKIKNVLIFVNSMKVKI